MPELKPLLELCRLPNVFTALSNVLAAYLLVHEDLGDVAIVVPLLLSSALLYTAGMVLNDVFDVDQDSQERPERPIPSGRVSEAFARRLGWGLLGAGVACGWIVSGLLQTFESNRHFTLGQVLTPGLVASLLALSVVAYDGPIKRTPLGPLNMGLCRSLNVLLGLSTAATGLLNWHPMHWAVAGGVGIYVVGITVFARTEAQERSNALQLLVGMLVMLGGVALLGYFPQFADDTLPEAALPLRIAVDWRWLFMWGIFGFFVVRRCLPPIFNGSPTMVQFAVKQSIFAIVIFDAAIATATRGPLPYALVIVGLLIPMQFLGRWVYST
jgi:4-hydroxybenzoate polyprenyltransferase